MSRGERRNLREQSITKCAGDLCTVLDVGTVKYASKFLGHMSSNDGGTLGVADRAKLLSISVECLQGRIELPSDRVLVDSIGKRAHHGGSIARRGGSFVADLRSLTMLSGYCLAEIATLTSTPRKPTTDTTPAVPTELHDAVTEALDTLTAVTGVDAEALFGTRVVENLETLPASAAYAGGFLEGAALACGLTVLEFLDLLAQET